MPVCKYAVGLKAVLSSFLLQLVSDTKAVAVLLRPVKPLRERHLNPFSLILELCFPLNCKHAEISHRKIAIIALKISYYWGYGSFSPFIKHIF